jgi:cytochrome b
MTRVLVWDVPERLFHWLLALLVIVSLVSAKIGGNAMQYHLLSGYTVLALVLFRVLWGFFGGTHARFSSFLRGPAAVIAYLRGLIRSRTGQQHSHNPAGAWAVVLVLAMLLAQAGTGLFANDDIAAEGPLAKLVSKALSDRVTGFHHLNAKLLYALVGLHVSAMVFHFFYNRENLLKPIVTGFKEVAPDANEASQKPGNVWLAAVLFAACAGAVYLLIRLPAA